MILPNKWKISKDEMEEEKNKKGIQIKAKGSKYISS